MLPYWLSKIIIEKTNTIEFVAAVDMDFPIFVCGSFLTKKETMSPLGSNWSRFPIRIAGVITNAVPDKKHCKAVSAQEKKNVFSIMPKK